MQITANRPSQAADLAHSTAAKPGKAPPDKPGEAISAQAQARAELNSSIVKASIETSISSKNEPLALLLKSAITRINEILEPELGKNALQNALGQDNTPEGTAGRIVSLSTGFFEAFKQQHPGEDEADVLKNFMATIRRGFEQGFQEASDILDGLGVLSGDIASGIGKTHELVLKGYADFEAAHSSSRSDDQDVAAAA
jgi:hypothetical protein